METIKKQTYKNIVTIVHSDDPRDEYVKGDIVIHGTVYGSEYGNGSYNLYNNKLLRAIPPDKPGWFHFIDDDDKYASDDVIEKLVENAKKDHVNVARVQRWNKTIWPKHWGSQRSFQTECFFMHTDYRHKAKWWGNRGGDHHYSKQLTKVLPTNWIENLIICKAQEGKGHGRKLDKGGVKVDYSKSYSPDKKVAVLGLNRHYIGPRSQWFRQGQIVRLKYALALELEKQGKLKITNHSTYIEAKN